MLGLAAFLTPRPPLPGERPPRRRPLPTRRPGPLLPPRSSIWRQRNLLAAGGDQPGIGEYATHRDAPRCRVDLVVDEVDRRLVREAILVFQPQPDRQVSVGRRRDLAFRDRLADLQQGRFIHIEIDVHRVQRHHRGQERLVLVHEIAEGEVVAAHLAVDGGNDVRELLVQLVDVQALLFAITRALASSTEALYWSSVCSLTAPGIVLASAPYRVKVTSASLSCASSRSTWLWPARAGPDRGADRSRTRGPLS